MNLSVSPSSATTGPYVPQPDAIEKFTVRILNIAENLQTDPVLAALYLRMSPEAFLRPLCVSDDFSSDEFEDNIAYQLVEKIQQEDDDFSFKSYHSLEEYIYPSGSIKILKYCEEPLYLDMKMQLRLGQHEYFGIDMQIGDVVIAYNIHGMPEIICLERQREGAEFPLERSYLNTHYGNLQVLSYDTPLKLSRSKHAFHQGAFALPAQLPSNIPANSPLANSLTDLDFSTNTNCAVYTSGKSSFLVIDQTPHQIRVDACLRLCIGNGHVTETPYPEGNWKITASLTLYHPEVMIIDLIDVSSGQQQRFFYQLTFGKATGINFTFNENVCSPLQLSNLREPYQAPLKPTLPPCSQFCEPHFLALFEKMSPYGDLERPVQEGEAEMKRVKFYFLNYTKVDIAKHLEEFRKIIVSCHSFIRQNEFFLTLYNVKGNSDTIVADIKCKNKPYVERLFLQKEQVRTPDTFRYNLSFDGRLCLMPALSHNPPISELTGYQKFCEISANEKFALQENPSIMTFNVYVNPPSFFPKATLLNHTDLDNVWIDLNGMLSINNYAIAHLQLDELNNLIVVYQKPELPHHIFYYQPSASPQFNRFELVWRKAFAYKIEAIQKDIESKNLFIRQIYLPSREDQESWFYKIPQELIVHIGQNWWNSKI